MARKKIREYDSKRLLWEHLKRLAGIDLQILSAQVIGFHSRTLPPPRACLSDRLVIWGWGDREEHRRADLGAAGPWILRLWRGGLSVLVGSGSAADSLVLVWFEN